jgi:toxin FitB
MSFLVDTNILIYHVAGISEARDFLTRLISEDAFNISLITKIEFLGWHAQTAEGFEKCRRLVDLSRVLPITMEIADRAVGLRRTRNIKLPDAVIAATAAANGLNLVTRNADDFKGLPNLEVLNPFERRNNR